MMVKKMAVAELKAHLAEALCDVEAGARVVIERRGNLSTSWSRPRPGLLPGAGCRRWKA
ncbi:MAG: hypothetical protein AB1938_22775 [Myxococcota bacterium]